MSPPKTPLLLCCDWGTTSFRLQLVEADTLQIRAKTTEGEGILKTFRAWTASGRPEQDRLAFYLAAIHERIASLERDAGFPLSGVPLIISGMASASVGICDIAYRKLPLAVDGSDLEVLTMPASPEFPYPLAIVSGGCTDADVMRGEETLVVGALADHTVGDEAWLVILPGTHSKHVSIRQGRAVNVATYMTGEFFALLSQQSILAQTVEAGGGLEQAGLRDEFIRGVRDGANRQPALRLLLNSSAPSLGTCFQVIQLPSSLRIVDRSGTEGNHHPRAGGSLAGERAGVAAILRRRHSDAVSDPADHELRFERCPIAWAASDCIARRPAAKFIGTILRPGAQR
jgi:2-keto-3-deoxy-galactonokinase